MENPLPGLAADAVSDLLTDNVKRPDGEDASAFESQAKALKAMRAGIMELDDRVRALEAAPPAPFPFRAPS